MIFALEGGGFLIENDAFRMRGTTNSHAQNTNKKNMVILADNGSYLLPTLIGLIDWVQISLPNEFFNEIVARDLLLYFLDLPKNIDAWDKNKMKMKGYKSSLSYQNISIFFDAADEKNGIIISFSGQGCRQAELFFREGFSWRDMFVEVFSCGGRFTRIDIAIDDLIGYFNISDLINKLQNGECVTRFKEVEPKSKFNPATGEPKGWTLAFGNITSRTYIYMYEKGKQLDLDYFWNRTEIRLKNENADSLANLIIQYGDESPRIGLFASGILKNYISFRDKNPCDINKSRWKVNDKWAAFLKDVQALKISKPLPDACIERTEKWLMYQCSKGMAKMFFAFQDEDNPRDFEWMRRLIAEGYSKLTIEDKRQIDNFRRNKKKYTQTSNLAIDEGYINI